MVNWLDGLEDGLFQRSRTMAPPWGPVLRFLDLAFGFLCPGLGLLHLTLNLANLLLCVLRLFQGLRNLNLRIPGFALRHLHLLLQLLRPALRFPGPLLRLQDSALHFAGLILGFLNLVLRRPGLISCFLDLVLCLLRQPLRL